MTALLPNHPFCRFAALIEQQAGAALRALQSRHDLNATLLLFCCWYAMNQQGLLTKTQVKRLLGVIYAWHQRIVSPLGSLCNQLKQSELDTWAHTLSDDALTARRIAEQIEQLLVVDILPRKPRRNNPSLTQTVTHACLNVGMYCQAVYMHLDEADYPYLGAVLAAVFPDLEMHKAATLCRNVLSERMTKEPVQRNLLLGTQEK